MCFLVPDASVVTLTPGVTVSVSLLLSHSLEPAPDVCGMSSALCTVVSVPLGVCSLVSVYSSDHPILMDVRLDGSLRYSAMRS